MFFAKTVKKKDGLSKADKAVADAVGKAIKVSLVLLHGAAVKSIQKKSGGEVVTRYNPRRKQTVSREGDPPNTDTGNLVRNIRWQYNPKRLEGVVGTNVKYGLFLELGTKDMKARPWLGPARKKVTRQIRGLLASAKVVIE